VKPMSAHLLLRLALTATLVVIPWPIASQSPQACEYWVAPAPEGDDGNPGALNQPWATLNHASESLPDDTCTVWFKDGVYTGALTARDPADGILAQTNSIVLLTSDIHLFLPLLTKGGP